MSCMRHAVSTRFANADWMSLLSGASPGSCRTRLLRDQSTWKSYLEGMGEPATHGGVCLEREHLRFLREPSKWCGEDEPSPITFRFLDDRSTCRDGGITLAL